MPRPKKGRALDKKRKYATPTAALLRNGKHEAQSVGHPTPAHLTMREEARNTGGRNLWRPGSLLRHQAVQFVSAGELQPDHELPPEPPSLDRTTDVSGAATQQETAPSVHTTNSNVVDEGAAFFIDLTGEDAPQTGMADPITNIVSDESSEDEIVFHGRHKWKETGTRLLDDHTEVQTNTLDPTQRGNQDAGKQFATAPPENPAKNAALGSDGRRQTLHTVTKSASDDTEDSDTGQQQPEKQYAENIFDGDFDVFTDYILNIDDEYYHKDITRVAKKKAGAQISTGEIESHPRGRAPSDSCLHANREFPEQGYSPESNEVRETQRMSTHAMPQSKRPLDHDMESQPSDIYDSQFEVDLDELDILEDLSIQDGEQRHLNHLRLAKHKKGMFPTATTFADALESDPYYGFDIMDFDRPSLRKKSKAKYHAPNFELSDSELEMELVRAWQNDRDKKKTRKQRRENLRSKGLLGRGLDNADLKVKYTNGITLEELRTEIHTFLLSSRNSLPLPPMPKQRRKLIHDLASALSLNSKSRGKGASRFPILHKTSRTPECSTKTVPQINRILSAGSFKSKSLDKNGLKSSQARRGQPGGSVSYMDGDVVGASAPEIGAGNKGRAMLEKMGWSTGTALGATNNKGILLPVAHVVKNSKAGLG
ncbi:hypothetical protein P170DRAFT_85925 [Aspergillus steynii IBT 23096]|uniref:Protein SQS1 n=1 Tax=Aspergillus steynii IBT 23096 TaxID=1392250 RepID=A0A2I2GFU9_9EURO|nr:uncharacterized protein P170DRAFT_85925 [Aspergillus steynii IBT 23096]PLB51765.1 hypothetical protein P170DRAFT_85925 [Aspergillus steynii IBT 23096]